MLDADRLHARDAEDLADALAFAPCYSGRKRIRDSGEIMARIVAEWLVGRPRGQTPAYRA